MTSPQRASYPLRVLPNVFLRGVKSAISVDKAKRENAVSSVSGYAMSISVN